MLRQYRLGLLTGRSAQRQIRRISLWDVSPTLDRRSWSSLGFPSSFRAHGSPRSSIKLQRSSVPYSTVVVQSTRKPSRLRRWLYSSVLFFGTGYLTFFFGLDHFFPLLPGYLMGSLPTDAETLALYTPQDDIAREVDEHIRNHPYVKKLRAESRFIESRPHLKIPAEIRGHSLTAGTLTGENKIVVPPLYFNDPVRNELISIFYLGSDVAGHPGVVHGGLLATILDEGLARCCFPALPNKVAVTAMLNIEYKKMAMTGNFFVLKAHTTEVEGRKAFVEGHIEMLDESEEGGHEVLTKAKALFVEPRGAKTMTSIYKVT